MKLTKRDIEMFEFINQFGFCETPHLAKRFSLKLKLINKLTCRLVKNGYLVKETEFYGKYALYRLTQKASEYTSLAPLTKLSPGAYHHNKAVIELHLQLSKIYPEATWISERHLLTEKDPVGRSGHLADAHLIFRDKIIAIEVELSSKSNRRLEAIIKSYITNLSINEVWYFCSMQVLPAVKRLADNLSYIKIFTLSDYTDG